MGKADLLKHWQLSTVYTALHGRRQKPSHKTEQKQTRKYNTSTIPTDLSEIISTRSKRLAITRQNLNDIKPSILYNQ
jgi:hypothetical protein